MAPEVVREDYEAACTFWYRGFSTASGTKHIEARQLFPHDLTTSIESGILSRYSLSFRWIPTVDQLADFCTKGVASYVQFDRIRKGVMESESILFRTIKLWRIPEQRNDKR